jgi:probable rRNA maturation factor
VLTFPAPRRTSRILIAISPRCPIGFGGAAHRMVSHTHEATALAIHGALHLLGYDDETEPERDEMVRLMNDHLRRENMKVDENWASLPHAEEIY